MTRATAPLQRIAELVTRELGIMLPDTKLPVLQGRVERRMRELGLTDVSDYNKRLFDANAAHERLRLFDAVTTNKTDFFREPSHFARLRESVLPELRARAGRRAHAMECKVWCAGCSTGQEVYTLAMVLAEEAQAHSGFTYAILGTDVSTRVLDEARSATYDETLIEPVAPELRHKYLLRSKQRDQKLIRIVAPLRERVRFARLNFMDDHYALPRDFDVVFFRNVLIYFDRPTQQRVLTRICQHLRPGGHLFVGHSESLNALDLPLTACGDSLFQKHES